MLSRFTVNFLVCVAIVLTVVGLIFSLPIFMLGIILGGIVVALELAIEDVYKFFARRRRERMLKKYGSTFGARDQ